MKFNIKRIDTPKQLSDVQRLLYDELVIGQRWKVDWVNPIGIKISRNKLTDNYDSVSNWFAVSSDNNLIGCVRVHGLLNSKHELEHYGKIPVFLKDGSYQISRLVIKRGYRYIPTVLPRLIRTLVRFSYVNGIQYLFNASTFPLPGSLYLKFQMRHCEQRYRFPGSNEDAHLFVADREAMEKSIQYSTRLIERYKKDASPVMV